MELPDKIFNRKRKGKFEYDLFFIKLQNMSSRFFSLDEQDPNYDPSIDESRKRKKSTNLTTSKRKFLVDWLQKSAKDIKDFTREKVTWSDAFMKKKKEKMFDFQCESVDEAFSRYRKCVKFYKNFFVYFSLMFFI